MNPTNSSIPSTGGNHDASSLWLEHNSNTTVQHRAGYFYYSTEATIMACTSGALSTLSSTLIILIILRSREFLSSSYHRIMFFMSISDIVASVPITLATLPMPSDVLYPFHTLTVGNKNTCSAQAFTIVLGQVCVVLANVILNLYYLFKLRYNKSDNFIKKKLEPIGFILSVAIGLTISCIALGYDMLNPTPYVPFCFAGSYPFDCLMDDKVECIAGKVSQKEETTFKIIYSGILVCAFFSVLISMLLVILSGFKTRQLTKRSKEEMQDEKRGSECIAPSVGQFYDLPQVNNPTNALAPDQEYNAEYADSVLKVALMYIGAYLLTWIWSIIAVASGSFSEWGNIWNFLDRAKSVFNPAQGFFNLLIFLYNKIHILRESREEIMSFCQALRIVIVNPWEVPEFLVPSLDIVDKDIEMRKKETKEQEEFMNSEQNDVFEEDLVQENYGLSSSPDCAPSSSLGFGSLSTASEPRRQSISKRISEYGNQRNRGIPEDMLSIETPDSVLAPSSRNDENLSYMSKSFNGFFSDSVVSSTASTVKRRNA